MLIFEAYLSFTIENILLLDYYYVIRAGVHNICMSEDCYQVTFSLLMRYSDR
jgi:hypothetical protein